MSSKYFLVTLAATSLLISGCATVKLSDSGEKVRVLDPDEIATCKKLGQSNASVTSSVLGIPRPIETVTKELATIGRNSAAKMNGDTIVPLTVVDEGKQSFVVYKCIAPES